MSITNPNRDYFCHVYPKHWLSGKRQSVNATHYEYQQITLDKLDCFAGCSVLECGCGSGDLLERLHRRDPAMRLTGVDLGWASLQRIAQGSLKASSTSLVHGDIGSLPFPSASFDRVLSSSVLWYVPDASRAIREMIRVLKPGGRFVFDVRNPYHVTNAWSRVSLRLRRLAGANPPVYSFFSPRALRTTLAEHAVEFDIAGYFVLLPTRLPIVGVKWGNWARYTRHLSFGSGRGKGQWLAQKLLVAGHKSR